MSNSAVKIENLSFTYPNGFIALENIQLDIKVGEFVGIIGQNGAGKSTLLKNIIGLLKPTSGDVNILDCNTRETSVAKLSTRVGFVLQNPDRQLFADNVYDEIAFGPKNLKLPQEEIKRRVAYAIEFAGLEGLEKRYPPALSAGDRAKVVIASVMAMEPEVIILDEPTTGQDEKGCHQIMNIAKRFHDMGRTVIVVTHHMALVTQYAERTIVFCKGEVLLDGPTRIVFGQPEILKKSYVVPPQITQLANALGEQYAIEDTVLTIDELEALVLKKLK
ncbi:MAG: ATP-binding cassette domain-containing protein [Clostridia bacterium]